jgi:hypothetical protein
MVYVEVREDARPFGICSCLITLILCVYPAVSSVGVLGFAMERAKPRGFFHQGKAFFPWPGQVLGHGKRYVGGIPGIGKADVWFNTPSVLVYSAAGRVIIR